MNDDLIDSKAIIKKVDNGTITRRSNSENFLLTNRNSLVPIYNAPKKMSELFNFEIKSPPYNFNEKRFSDETTTGLNSYDLKDLKKIINPKRLSKNYLTNLFNLLMEKNSDYRNKRSNLEFESPTLGQFDRMYYQLRDLDKEKQRILPQTDRPNENKFRNMTNNDMRLSQYKVIRSNNSNQIRTKITNIVPEFNNKNIVNGIVEIDENKNDETTESEKLLEINKKEISKYFKVRSNPFHEKNNQSKKINVEFRKDKFKNSCKSELNGKLSNIKKSFKGLKFMNFFNSIERQKSNLNHLSIIEDQKKKEELNILKKLEILENQRAKSIQDFKEKFNITKKFSKKPSIYTQNLNIYNEDFQIADMS